MEIQAIKDAVTANPTLLDALVPYVAETEAGKTYIDKKAGVIAETKIGEEIRKTHSRYDEDVFAVLGERPQTIDGKLEKSYDMVKRHLTDLKRLKGIEGELSKDPVIAKLKSDLDAARLDGGKHYKDLLEQAQKDFETKEKGYKEQIESAGKLTTEERVKNDIKIAQAGLKFNPDVSETMRNLALQNVEAQMLKNHKVLDDGKIVYTKEDGTTIMNDKFDAANASEVIASMDVVKEITLKETSANPGGGADKTGSANVQTVKVEGKDAKKLVFPTGTTFASKTDFIEKSETALLEAGIARGDADWDTLKNAAYTEHNVTALLAE